MSGQPIPVLWLCGPPGVGKSTVAWEIYSQLTGLDRRPAYVDIDQLGICYPEPPSDPGRYRMKERNLGALAASFRAAGADCLIVSGVVDGARGVNLEGIPRAALTVCRLRADRDQLVQRLAGRRGSFAQSDDALREAEVLDATNFADVSVDTSGLSVGEVAGLLLSRGGPWHSPISATGAMEPPTPVEGTASADGPILWLFGPTGVGKSTVGFNLYLRLLRTGRTAAYVDIDQIGFCRTAPAAHSLRADNLAVVWTTYRSAGADALVVVGPLQGEGDAALYAQALPKATFAWCRLHASRDQLTSRIMTRREGGSWAQPGDPLKGRSTTDLLRAAKLAGNEAEALERDTLGIRVHSDGLSVDETVDAILQQSAWPA